MALRHEREDNNMGSLWGCHCLIFVCGVACIYNISAYIHAHVYVSSIEFKTMHAHMYIHMETIYIC